MREGGSAPRPRRCRRPPRQPPAQRGEKRDNAYRSGGDHGLARGTEPQSPPRRRSQHAQQRTRDTAPSGGTRPRDSAAARTTDQPPSTTNSSPTVPHGSEQQRSKPSHNRSHRRRRPLHLSPPSGVRRGARARRQRAAAAAHRDVANATDTADVTVAVHRLRGTDGHAQSHGSRRQSTHAASPPTHRYHHSTRNERAMHGTRAHRVVIRRIALHHLRDGQRRASEREQPGSSLGRTPFEPSRADSAPLPDLPSYAWPASRATRKTSAAYRRHVPVAHRPTKTAGATTLRPCTVHGTKRSQHSARAYWDATPTWGPRIRVARSAAAVRTRRSVAATRVDGTHWAGHTLDLLCVGACARA